MRRYHGKYVMLVCVLLLVGIFMEGRNFAETDDFLSPISVVAGVDGKELYIAETTANQIAVFDIVSGKVTKVISVDENPVGLDISANGSKLYVTSAVPDGKVQIVDVLDGSVTDSIAAGHTPVAVVAGSDGKTLYVCNQYNNNIGVVDLNSKKQVAAITVVREPVAAALTSDGKYLFVTNHLPAGPANSGYCASIISVIDTVARKVIKNIELPDGSTNVRGITISPDGRNAYVTHVLARYQFPVTYLEKGWINTNAMTIIDVPGRKFVNTVLVDDVDSGAANPYGVACTADGKNILVTHAGSYELSVIDRKGLHERLLPAETARNFTSEIHSGGGRKLFDSSYSAGDVPNDLTFMAGIRRRLKLGGIGPRGLAVIGKKVYIAEIFTDSLGVVDIGADAQSAVEKIPLGKVKPATFIRKGEVLFNDASLSYQKWNSCTSCHTGDGRASMLNWDLLNDGVGNPKNIRSMLLSHKTPPAMITGVRENAEVAVRSGIRYIQFASTTERKAQAIDGYLKSLKPIASPYLVNGKLSKAAENGQKLFSKAGCLLCHSRPLYTNMSKYDIGTGTEQDDNRKYDTPTLVEVWRTAPYLHDGRAATIKDVLTKFNKNDRHGRTSELTDKEIEELAEFVLSL
ncbi:MAG: cell surface protein [Planctomycetes bacterium]|nr:cell surface protein [Planctomycetota bacterium]